MTSADSGRLALTLSRALQKADPVVVSLLVLVNGLALFNAVYHPPRVAFDANAHIWYVETVAAGRLPTMADTYEAFSPPLSYLPPALPLALVSGSPLAGALVMLSFGVGTLPALLGAGWLFGRGSALLPATWSRRVVGFALVALALAGLLQALGVADTALGAFCVNPAP